MIFYFFDKRAFNREGKDSKGRMAGEIKTARRKLHIQGVGNIWLLAVLVGGILLIGYVLHPTLDRFLGERKGDLWTKVLQTIFMVLLAVFSYRTTPKGIHAQNRFHIEPLWEVAALFFGIFGAMLPVLAYLETRAPEMAIQQSWQYFWVSGLLSAFLDNAPTYLTTTAMAASQHGLSLSQLGDLAEKFPRFLAAISCGSSFMGALTYIGNGPNFMVKAIAEKAGVKMPSFGGYLLWSSVVLIPIFLVVTILFF